MESTKRTVGDNIVELREFHGLSRWQLAKAAKLGYGTLKQWETERPLAPRAATPPGGAGPHGPDRPPASGSFRVCIGG
jgi:hypothetical protein